MSIILAFFPILVAPEFLVYFIKAIYRPSSTTAARILCGTQAELCRRRFTGRL
ncbi:MAG: hypothetical protein MJY97_01425 [Bacteroidales bacterium]|nr:hypothetical protein [Bacteroidales bacterium]